MLFKFGFRARSILAECLNIGLAIRNVIEALGGMTQISRRTGLNRENLYRVLSEQGNPELKSLEKLLKALGLRLAVEVDQNMDHAA